MQMIPTLRIVPQESNICLQQLAGIVGVLLWLKDYLNLMFIQKKENRAGKWSCDIFFDSLRPEPPFMRIQFLLLRR